MNKHLSFLLIDDDEDDRELFQMALENTGLQVSLSAAPGASEALSMLRNGSVKPDFVFLDLNMPQITGRDCLVELKKDSGLAHIPVIIFSTSSDPRDVKDMQQLGAVDFITKPSKNSELTQILSDFIARKNETRQKNKI